MVSEKTNKERQAYWFRVVNEARDHPDSVTAYCSKYVCFRVPSDG